MKIICSILLIILSKEILTKKIPLKRVQQSQDSSQPFIFVLSPHLVRSQDTQMFRLPSIESLPAMLTSIVNAKNNNQEQRQERNIQQSSFRPSPVDPVVQRDTIVIDEPVIGEHIE